MKKLPFLALGAMLLAQSAMAQGIVTLRQEKSAANTAGAALLVGVVAKVEGVLEIDLVNTGFGSDLLIEEGDEILKSYAFGQPPMDVTDPLAPIPLLTAGAESFSINAGVAPAALQTEVCTSAADFHISKLTAYAAVNGTAPGAGSCVVTAGAVAAKFYVDYKIRAGGGIVGDLTVSVDNGVASDYLVPDATLNFLTASVSDLDSQIVIDGVDIGSGQAGLDHDSEGTLMYDLTFAISGGTSKSISRATYSHILQVL